MWGRRRDGLTNNFTLAVYMQFLVAADTRSSVSIIHLTNQSLSFAKLVSFGDKENAKVTH